MNALPPQWNGSRLAVTAKLVPRYLWQTASIDVFLDEQCILRTGGQFKFVGSHASEFEYRGTTHSAVLKGGFASLRSFPFRLTLDGQAVLESRVHMSNWPIALWPWVVLASIFILLGQNSGPKPNPAFESGPPSAAAQRER